MTRPFQHSRRTLLTGALATASTLALPARAQGSTKIVFAFTPATEFASIFVAKEEGYFAKRNIDLEPKFIPLTPSIPPAIQSESVHMGGPTSCVFLQAVAGGLDLVVAAGGGSTSKSITGVGLVARAGSGIKTAQDCIGKKIGAPGLGADLHVAFRAWLKLQGVDYTKVNFVEASFPQHGDLLRGGSLDAVVTLDPFMSRILQSGAGSVVSYFTTFLPEGNPTVVYAARRDWAQKNAPVVKAFRESIVEAAAFILNTKNTARVREHIGKHIKLPPEVLATIQISPPQPIVSEKHLAYWAGLMREQSLLRSPIDISQLIVK